MNWKRAKCPEKEKLLLLLRATPGLCFFFPSLEEQRDAKTNLPDKEQDLLSQKRIISSTNVKHTPRQIGQVAMWNNLRATLLDSCAATQPEQRSAHIASRLQFYPSCMGHCLTRRIINDRDCAPKPCVVCAFTDLQFSQKSSFSAKPSHHYITMKSMSAFLTHLVVCFIVQVWRQVHVQLKRHPGPQMRPPDTHRDTFPHSLDDLASSFLWNWPLNRGSRQTKKLGYTRAGARAANMGY